MDCSKVFYKYKKCNCSKKLSHWLLLIIILYLLELIKRNVAGYAIGGLSGGEAKEDFWKIVHLSTDLLPQDKPRYLMGVG